MTVHFSQDDIVTLEEFGGIDYLIPQHSNRSFLEDVLQRVILLKWARGRELVLRFRPFVKYNEPFDTKQFHATSQIAFRRDDLADRENVSDWLLRLPIQGSARVYVYWKTEDWKNKACPALIARWEDFATRLWPIIWSVFDHMCIIDDAVQWAVIFGPEPYVVFAEKGAVDPELPKSDPAHGLGLITVRPDGEW